jgi:hypothetical protein
MWATAFSPALSRRSIRAALLALMLAGTCASAVAVDRVRAADVMAAYLRYIAELTTWPDQGGDAAGQPIRVGVIGQDPNGVMDTIRARNRSEDKLEAQGRPVRLLNLNPGDDPKTLTSCNLLFLSQGAEQDWERIRPIVDRLPIVTVSELEGFADQGGMIEYFIERRSGKVRMKVNLTAMRAAGITFSARFLALKAVLVVGEREEA